MFDITPLLLAKILFANLMLLIVAVVLSRGVGVLQRRWNLSSLHSIGMHLAMTAAVAVLIGYFLFAERFSSTATDILSLIGAMVIATCCTASFYFLLGGKLSRK